MPKVFRPTWRFGFAISLCENEPTKPTKLSKEDNCIANTGIPLVYFVGTPEPTKTDETDVIRANPPSPASLNFVGSLSNFVGTTEPTKLTAESRAFTHKTATTDPKKRISSVLSVRFCNLNIRIGNLIAQATA